MQTITLTIILVNIRKYFTCYEWDLGNKNIKTTIGMHYITQRGSYIEKR